MNMDEQHLVGRIQAGDEWAFAEIVHIYKDRIVNYLYQVTGDYQKAADLSQETFLRVFFKANKYRPIAPFSSWIYAIASNLAKTELKKNRRANLVSFDDIQPGLEASTPSEESTDSGCSKRHRRVFPGGDCRDHSKARRNRQSQDQPGPEYPQKTIGKSDERKSVLSKKGDLRWTILVF